MVKPGCPIMIHVWWWLVFGSPQSFSIPGLGVALPWEAFTSRFLNRDGHAPRAQNFASQDRAVAFAKKRGTLWRNCVAKLLYRDKIFGVSEQVESSTVKYNEIVLRSESVT